MNVPLPPPPPAVSQEPDLRPGSGSHAAAERHLGTGHLLQNLGRRAVSGGAVTAGAQLIKFGLNLGGIVVLARLLSPADFGLVAMAGALMPILRTFREGGLSTATVQKEGITQAQVSNLFWINLALGATITGIGAALAPAVAWFYDDDRLLVVTILLSLSFALSGGAVQHLALLNRQMRFLAVASIDVIASVTGFATGLWMAWRGYGYWSLVGMQLAATVAEVVLTWVASGWWPHLPRRGAGTRPLLRFGASMTIYILLRRLAGSADVILLGRFYGASAVGLYTRASALLLRPLDQFITPFDTVFIPILSRLQNDPARYRQVFLQAYGTIAICSFTFAGLLVGLAKPLVLFLLGGEWVEVVPIFAWMTIAAIYIPMNYAAMWLLTTQGRSRDLLRLGVILPFLTIVSISIGIPFGVTGVALAMAGIGLVLRLPVQYHLTGRAGPVSSRDLWKVFLGHLPLWAAVAGSTIATLRVTAVFPPLGQLALGTVAGGAAAALSIIAWPHLRCEAAFVIEQVGRLRSRRARA